MRVISFNKPMEENGYLCTNYLCDFFADGIKFCSVDQYIEYEKAITFKDTYHADKILEVQNNWEIKDIAKLITNYNDKIWNGKKQIVLYKANLAKFSQNEDLKQNLLATEDTTIAYCNKMDKILGIGFNKDDTRIYKISNWMGQNLLGFSLMEVRDTLKKEI